MIRPGRAADEPALAALARRAWLRAWGERADPERGPQDDLAADALVFDLDGLIAGYARLRPRVLVALAVDPPAQGAGVGTALLAAAEQRMGPGPVRAVVAPDDEPARAFLTRFGWQDDEDGLAKVLP